MKGGTLQSCPVCRLRLKVKNERGRFGLRLPWPDLALGGFRIVSEKWTDQCEDCSLKKKRSGIFP